jgi:hypothetical protein
MSTYTSLAKSHATNARSQRTVEGKLDELAQAIYELARTIDDIDRTVKQLDSPWS